MEDFTGFVEVKYDRYGRDLKGDRQQPVLALDNTVDNKITVTDNKPAPINIKELKEDNVAVLRTVAGDIRYPLFGIDLTSKRFLVLYILSEDIRFEPKEGNFYYIGIKIEEEGTFLSEVYFSGVMFNLPNSPIVAIVFHCVK